MLNHTKLFNELTKATTSFFVDYQREQTHARELWEKVCNNHQLAATIASADWSFLVPRWQGALNHQEPIDGQREKHTVFAVDGSQIYPDRHQGLACYVINIGTALLDYGLQSSAHFSSQPFLFSGTAEETHPDIVNCQRTEFEFNTGLEMGKQHKDALFLFDGSLIFWHLDSKEEAVKNKFLTSYCATLQQLHDAAILHAGYISLPKSRELVNILRAASELLGLQQDFKGECLVDTDVVEFFLKPHQRTLVFENRSPIVQAYPPALRPYFFYLHNGTEIARVEIPAWIANDAALVNRIATTVLDQSLKGNGYPVCLAEAHEQAVVTTADRECFYLLLQRVMHKKNVGYTVSQKSLHKRVLGI